MAFIITENCDSCRFTNCVEVCPVSCFHGNDERLYIDPETCIDCAACVDACPVHAIYDQFDIPDKYVSWIDINATKYMELPVVDGKQEPLTTAESRRKELGFD